MSVIIPGETLNEKLQRRDRARLRSAMVWGFELSKDPNRRLGAILIHSDDRQSSLGYNGLATGIPDSEKNWERPLKYELVIHAEMNALDNRSFPTIGGSLFCLLKPCHTCLNRLINNKVQRIVWLNTDVDFKNNNEEIWNMLAFQFSDKGGQLIEYKLDEIDIALAALYNEKHDGYTKQKLICPRCNEENILTQYTQITNEAICAFCSNIWMV